ncbi:hypothetical protein vseg_011722 [Gypsophila vaccaria]
MAEAEKQSICQDSVKQTECETEQPRNDDMLRIMHEDVEEEIEYWSQAVVCYILGANPPWEVIEGFIRRIWTRFNIDKIYFMPEGVFLVRFKSMEMEEKVLQCGYYLFDSIPLIFRVWSKDMELKKTDVTVVPAWIQFRSLPLKFWGKSLSKITGLFGKYIKKDVATEERTKLGYARVMVELRVDQQFPSQVAFMDENGDPMTVDVEYEWKPITCNQCKGMGHKQEQCRKGEPPKNCQQEIKKIWRPVVKEVENETTEKGEDRVVQTTPRQPKRLTQMSNSKEGSQEGYSSKAFGSLSYKEVLSPTKQNVIENGEDPSPKPPNG